MKFTLIHEAKNSEPSIRWLARTCVVRNSITSALKTCRQLERASPFVDSGLLDDTITCETSVPRRQKKLQVPGGRAWLMARRVS